MAQYADFTYSPTYPTVADSTTPYPVPPMPNNKVTFLDKSVGPTPATTWYWYLNGGLFSKEQNAEYIFDNPGVYTISLQVQGNGWDETKTVELMVYHYVLPSVSSPIAGQQFFDNDGKPLAYGWVHSYSAGGYSNKQRTYNGYIARQPNAFSVQLDADGRYLIADVNYPTIALPMGTDYNFVVTKEDGETVVQTFDNIYTPAINAGDNIRVEGYDINNQFTFTISDTTPSVRFGRGEKYLFWLQPYSPFLGNGTPAMHQAVLRKTPVTLYSTPYVEYVPNQGFLFHKSGAYELNIMYNLTPVGAVDIGSTEFGVKMSSTTIVIPEDAELTSKTDYTPLPMDYSSVTSSCKYVIAANAGDILEIGPYAVDAPGTLYYNARGSVEITRVGDVFVPIQKPTATIVATPTSGAVPLTVDFSADVTGDPSLYVWFFGDGSNAYGDTQTYTYYTSGEYNVTLLVRNSAGWSDVATQKIVVTEFAAPSAYFNPINQNISWVDGGTTVEFFDLSQHFPTSWLWDFGDGSTSTEQNPVHLYTAIGNYTVSLQATNDYGSNTKTGYVNLTTGPISPLTPFDVTNTSYATINTVNITIPATAGQTIECGTCNLPGTVCNGDSYIRLYNPYGVLIAENDDYVGLASFISTTAPVTGNYIFAVGAYANNQCDGVASWQVV